jgi:hypothetical protein
MFVNLKDAPPLITHLLVMLPRVSISGIYQIDVGSYHSIVDINSGLDYVQAMVNRFAMVPLVLRRVPRETHGSGKKDTHYTLQLLASFDVNTLNLLRQDSTRVLTAGNYSLPAPEDLNPKMDEGGVVEEVEDEPEPQPIEEANQPKQDARVIEAIVWLERHKILDLEKTEKILGKDRNRWGLGDLKELRSLYDRVVSGESLDQILEDKLPAAVPEIFQGINLPSAGRVDRLAMVTCPNDHEYRTGGWCQDECRDMVDCQMWKVTNKGGFAALPGLS